MVIHENFNDFVLFLYIHMAYADGEFHDLEKSVILEKVKKLYPDEEDAANRLSEAESVYRAMSSQDVTGLITDTFRRYNYIKSSQKYRIYTDMYDIIEADGKVEESETRALNELKQIINMGSRRV